MSDTQERPVSQLVKRLEDFAVELAECVEEHKERFADWIRDDGKRSVTIVEYQLSKNDLGQEARLVAEAADALQASEERIADLELRLQQTQAGRALSCKEYLEALQQLEASEEREQRLRAEIKEWRDDWARVEHHNESFREARVKLDGWLAILDGGKP